MALDKETVEKYDEEAAIMFNRRSGITKGTNEDLPLSGHTTPDQVEVF